MKVFILSYEDQDGREDDINGIFKTKDGAKKAAEDLEVYGDGEEATDLQWRSISSKFDQAIGESGLTYIIQEFELQD